MLLDIVKNELVFSQIGNRDQFRASLKSNKTITFREVNGRFYVPFAHFQSARVALKDYSGQISLSNNYQTFARRFITCNEPVEIHWHPAMCEIRGKGLPFHLLMPKTSYFTKTALRSKMYEKGIWDGTVHLFDVIQGVFPSGLLERFIMCLRTVGVHYTIKRYFEYPTPYLTLTPTFPFTPTDDQIAAVAALDKANYGIAKLPTGFGKTSYVAAALIAKKGVRSLFLANQRVLIYDAKKDFEQVFSDEPIGIIGDGEFDVKNITVASIQGVIAGLKPPTALEIKQAEDELRVVRFQNEGDDSKKAQQAIKKAEKKVATKKARVERSVQLTEYLKTIDLFIVDENQVLGTDMWKLFLDTCPAPYRYSLSATDTRTDGGRIEIIAATGERRYESSAAEQIEKGRLAEFKAYFKYFDHGLSPEYLKELQIDFHQAYKIFIVENDARNNYLIDVMIDWMNEGHSILGLVTRIEHAERVMALLEARGYKEGLHYRYADGKTPKKVRSEIIDDYREGKFPILLGTSIFDVGFNAKNASRVVRFNAGASEVREPQRAGRTVRMREDGSRGESIDIIDLNAPYFMQQGFKRMNLLKQEFGAERVEILKGTVKGNADYVRLEEVATVVPTETDDDKITEALKGFEPSPFPNLSKDDKDLLSILEEFQTSPSDW